MPIQDGYSYSLMDRIDIYRLAESVYYRVSAERRLTTRHLYRDLEHSYALKNYIDKQQLSIATGTAPTILIERNKQTLPRLTINCSTDMTSTGGIFGQ